MTHCHYYRDYSAPAGGGGASFESKSALRLELAVSESLELAVPVLVGPGRATVAVELP